ncbi:MAG: DNA translocase FtsK 4TM domain-containing protein, partial [Patescibacteria group bacterium]
MRRRRRISRNNGGFMSFFLGEPVGRSVGSRRIAPLRGARRRRKGNLSFDVESHVAREIFAVIYLALSLLLVLSVYGHLGSVGEAFSSALKPVFGFGIHFIPVTFFALSLALFFSKKTVFGLARITGIILLFVSLLSIFHLSVGTDVLYSAAKSGQFGGYIGFVMNFLFREILRIGDVGASIIFVAGLLIGGLLTFEFSIIEFLKKAKPGIELRRRKLEMTEEGVEALEEEEETDSVEEDAEINIIKPRSAVSEDDDDDSALEEMFAEGESEKSSDGFKVRHLGPVSEKEISTHTAVATSVEKYKDWEFPTLDLLDPPTAATEVDDEMLKENAELIRDKLGQFGIEVTMSDVHVGTTVIQYTLKPHEGVKIS